MTLAPISNHSPAQAGLVSVYLPTRNRAALLERALLSVLSQTYREIEVVVVNDGSTDGTDTLMQRLAQSEPRIVYSRLTESGGASAARNCPLEQVRGEFVTGLDDDDTFAPQHIARLMDHYRTEYSFVCSSRCDVWPEGSVPNVVDAGHIDLASLLHYNKIGNQALVERERILAVGGFDAALPALQDYDLWVRLVAHYGAAYRTRETTYQVHLEHGMQRISGSNERRRVGLRRFVEKHRKLMQPEHLVSMRLLEIKLSGERLGLLTAVRSMRRGNYKSVISQYVNAHLPWVQRAYHRWVSSHRSD